MRPVPREDGRQTCLKGQHGAQLAVSARLSPDPSLVFCVPSRLCGEGRFHLSSGLVSLNPCLALCPALDFQGLDVVFLLCSNEEGDGALRMLQFPRESRGPSERVAKQSLTV